MGDCFKKAGADGRFLSPARAMLIGWKRAPALRLRVDRGLAGGQTVRTG
jgi:hypothetical protein